MRDLCAALVLSFLGSTTAIAQATVYSTTPEPRTSVDGITAGDHGGSTVPLGDNAAGSSGLTGPGSAGTTGTGAAGVGPTGTMAAPGH